VASADPATVERVRLTLAEVRAGRTRTFVCRNCGRGQRTFRLTGRAPRICGECDPHTHAWQRELAERALRETIRVLADRVDELEGESVERALEGGDDMARLIVAARDALGEPDRYAVGRAVRMLAAAAGLAETRARLRLLAGAALGWERRVGADGRYPGSREAA
jgi:hypothetical protein